MEMSFAMRFFTYSNRIKHLCVSEALKNDLDKYKIDATVYYDRAPDEFYKISTNEAHALFKKLVYFNVF